jgi:predicted nucleic acid-binding protein
VSVFVDTSALYAILDADDAGHARASRVWPALVNEAEPLVTSNYTLLESHALLQSRLGMAAVRLLYDAIVPMLDVLWVDDETHRAGVDAVLVANRRQLSLVDCVSFVLMRRHRIARAFSLDPHFAEQGIDVLP